MPRSGYIVTASILFNFDTDSWTFVYR